MRGGLQLGPPGRWWDDASFAKTLGLRSEQKKAMDQIFDANKSSILSNYQLLQREEAGLDALTRSRDPQEEAIFSAIDRVTQARAALEKSTAHMLLMIRHEMAPEQIERLEEHR